MDSDCCLLVELAVITGALASPITISAEAKKTVTLDPYPYSLTRPFCFRPAQHKAIQAILVWDSNSKGQELHNIQETLRLSTRWRLAYDWRVMVYKHKYH